MVFTCVITFDQIVFNFLFDLPKRGVAVFINGRFSCMDLFECPGVLEKIWTKLLSSYAMEALEYMNQEKQNEKPDINKVIKAISDAECKEYSSVGMGTDIRIKGEKIIGSGLLSEQRLLHLSVFASHRSSNSNIRSRIARPSHRRENI